MDPHKKAWPGFHLIIHQTIHLLKIYLILHISFSCVCGFCWKWRQNSSIHFLLGRHNGEFADVFIFMVVTKRIWVQKRHIMIPNEGSIFRSLEPCVVLTVECGRLFYNLKSMLGFCKRFMSESLGLQRYRLGGRPSSQWLPDSCAELAGPHRC